MNRSIIIISIGILAVIIFVIYAITVIWHDSYIARERNKLTMGKISVKEYCVNIGQDARDDPECVKYNMLKVP
jgi:hypothetical protein